MGHTEYCLCCDEQVPFNTVQRNERIESTCIYCGFVLDVKETSAPPQPATKEHPPGGCALIAEDSKYTRRIIKDLIREKKFSEDVMSFENGMGLVSAYSKLLSEKVRVEFAIIDLNMPIMDGVTTARAIRTLEAQKNTERIPIIFFSGAIADDDLKKVMEEVDPAIYINKGSAPDPDHLVSRVEYLLGYISEKYRHSV